MKRVTFTKLVLVFFVVLMIIVPNLTLAFKVQDEERKMNEADVTLGSKPGLQSIFIRDFNQPVEGDAVQTSINVAETLMNTKSNDGLQEVKPDESNVGFKAELQKVQTDSLGFRHVRLMQSYKGLPVVGGELIVHINSQDVICQINGKYLPAIEVSVEPSISGDVALQIGLDDQQGKSELLVSKEPSLVIYDSSLTYHYVISHKGEEAGQWWYYVDAHTGEVIHRFNNIKYAGPTGSGAHESVSGSRLTEEDGSAVTMTGWKETSGNYYLYNYNDVWGIYDEDVSDWEQQTTNNWGTSDRAAISAGKNFALTQDWVTNVLGRNSFNDGGAFARGNVHTGTNYVNAYWDGTDFHFGDGDAVTADPLTSLDIVAHEYGHAITDYTSNLVYSYESGALNESYSDIIGTVVEFASQPDGTSNYPSGTPGQSDWLLGEDAWLADEALRDIKYPQRYRQPSYYMGTYWYTGSGDNGGVHTNSGVQNFAFYLLAEGGTGTNDGHSYDITGIGVTQASEVAMRANMVYLTSGSQYIDSREAWISAAADLSYDTATVGAVWDAVGVSSPALATIYGNVTDEITGLPVKFALVTGSYMGSGVTKFTRTNSLGYYELNDLEDGIWRLRAISRTHRPGFTIVNISGGGTYEKNFQLISR